MSDVLNSEYDIPTFYSLAHLSDSLIYRLPGCSDMMVRATIRDIYREFCQSTLCLRSYHRFESDDTCFTIPAKYGVIESVTYVSINGARAKEGIDYRLKNGASPVLVLSKRFLKVIDPDTSEDGMDPPRHPDTCKTCPNAIDPDTSKNGIEPRKHPEFYKVCPNVVEVYCVEIPRIGDENAPSWFYQKYADAIISGTLFNLFSMNGRPWSDPSQAQRELLRYNNFLSTARAKTADRDLSQYSSGHIDVLDMEGML